VRRTSPHGLGNLTDFARAHLAHPTDIYALAATRNQVLTAAGGKDITIYDTTSEDFPRVQTLENAHPLGCRHLVTSADGRHAASVGFGGEVKIWEPVGDGPDCTWEETTGVRGMVMLAIQFHGGACCPGRRPINSSAS
jgi:hypothetical protein